MFNAIARFSVRFRWLIIIAWIVAVPILTHYLPSLSSKSKSNNSQFLPSSSPSIKAGNLEGNFRGQHASASMTIVAATTSGHLTPTDNIAITRITQAVSRISGITDIKNQGVSADGQAQEFLVGIAAADPSQSTPLLNDIRGQLKKNVPSDLQLHLTGIFAESIDSSNSNTKGQSNTQTATLVLILVLLLVVFRSVLAPLVTLLPAGLALLIAQPIIAESTKIGVQVSFLTQILLIVLLLGAGTDYGLFLVFRTREELRNGHAPKDAVIKALTKVGESITYSAVTVCAALISLVFASFGLYKGIGPGLAIGLFIMLLIALTFLPAVLSILGRAVFWPSKTNTQKPKIGVWGKVADYVIKRPVVMLIVGIVMFGSLSAAIVGYKVTGFGNQGPPSSSDSAIGQQVVNQHFPAASFNPQQLILQFNSPVWNNLSVLTQAQQVLLASGYFKDLSGPFNANGHSFTPQQLQHLHDSDPNNPALQVISQFISRDGRTVQFNALLKNAKSGTTAAANEMPVIRTLMSKVASDVGASEGNINSNDAQSYDIETTATHDLINIIPIVLVIILILLVIMLRSFVAPWYLILTVGLSYFATLGFAMLAFVHLGGQEGLNFVLPFMLFIFCMALGEDYNILVMSRIREETHGGKSTSEAVSKAIGITGSTVTSAGIILAGTFAVLGIVGGSGNSQLQQIGFSIAFGILLDTFFVRTLLVPSIVSLLGRNNWWPSQLYRTSK